MNTKLDTAAVKFLIGRLAEVFEENKDRLNDLDTKVGDGDHGRSMALGFSAVSEWLAAADPASVGEILIEGGSRFNKAAGSTIGILMFQALREAGKPLTERSEIGLSELVAILDAMIAAIKKTGKAETGQRTILDSLGPVQDVLAGAPCGSREEVVAAIGASIEAAAAGAEKTRTMKPGVGRARWFADRSLGEIDPGAVSGALIVETVGRYLLSQLE